jgi:hypothetical protein
MNPNWFETEFRSGSKFVDQDGNIVLLHAVGSMAMQFTYINSGDVYVQFNTINGSSFLPSRDLQADGRIKDRIFQLSPVDDGFEQEKEKREKEQLGKERENLQNEIRIYMRDFSGALMFNIKEPTLNGEVVEQSEIIKDFSSLINSLLKIFSEGYNEIRDRKQFFTLVLNGFQYLQDKIGDIFADSDRLYPDISAKFFLESNGQVTLVISDEKEDVLQYEGHLQANNTVLSTKAMKYIIIPNLRDVLDMQD